jgi:hypothetical protein
MTTPQEFQDKVDSLTPFQKKVLKSIERAPNQHANRWEIVWNDFARQWSEKRRAHGAMFRAILQAGQAMERKGIVWVHPAPDQHGDYSFSSRRKWCEEEIDATN